jgi:hypothetical protein
MWTRQQFLFTVGLNAMAAWILSRLPWIIFTLVPTVGLAVLAIERRDAQKKWIHWLRISIIAIFAISVSIASFFANEDNAQRIENIINGLNRQSSDLNSVSNKLQSTSQLMAFNYEEVLNLERQTALQGETTAAYDSLLADADTKSRLAEYQVDSIITKADRLFRDTLYADASGIKAISQILVANTQQMILYVDGFEKSKQQFAGQIKDKATKVEGIQQIIDSLNAPDNYRESFQLLLDGLQKQPPTNLADLRAQVGTYSELVSAYRTGVIQVNGLLREFNYRMRQNTFAMLGERIQTQLSELEKLKQQALQSQEQPKPAR